MKRVLDLLQEDRGAITADWLALTGGIAILTYLVIGAIDQDITVFSTAADAAITIVRR